MLPFKKEHALGFDIAVEAEKPILSNVQENDHTWVFSKDMRILTIWGVVPIWEGRGLVWAMMSKQAAPHMLELTKLAKQVLDHMSQRRIEADARADFPAGARWLKMLGFKKEGVARCYYPDGTDAILFARIKT